jgi:N-carbamoyl-L-amino-acid hydrolase
MGQHVSDHVNGQRLWQRLMDFARIGATSKGGVCRLALSSEEIAARAQLVRWGRELGLEPTNDGAGNLFLRLAGSDPAALPLLIGSHIDSQPTGGKFDGAYGVLAAVESVQAIAEAGVKPRCSIDVVAWMNEEGSRFAPGMMGSAVFTGRRRLEDIKAVRDAHGISVGEALGQVLSADKEIQRRSLGFPVAGYVEAHIEQGPILEQSSTTIGVVTGIQGKRTFRVEVRGEESHAGTRPRSARRDSLVAAVDIIKALEKAIWDEADEVRFTIGKLDLEPNAPSVVPGRATFSIDLRHGNADTVRVLGDMIPDICARMKGRCDVAVTQLLYEVPLEFPSELRARIKDTAARLGLTHEELPSPAGHDSRYLHYVCPTAMIFIPCKGGISHNEAEAITPQDAEAGARVLADLAFELATA